jgi:O-antigen/teichoic acid export membrane protein
MAIGRGDGAAGHAAGIVASTLLAYAYQLVGGRLLGPEAFAPVSVLWTLMFLTGTVALTPGEQYVAREATAGRRVVARASWPLLVLVLATAAAAVTFTTLTREALFGGEPAFILIAVALVATTAPLFVVRGLSIGHRRFDRYGAMLTLEGIGRLALGAAGVALVGGSAGWAWGIGLGPLLGLLVAPRRLDRLATAPPSGGAGAFLAPYVGASAASQLLIAGAPLAVAALGAEAATISIVFVTFTLFRAPVTIVYLLQGRLLNAVVRLQLAGAVDRLERTRRRILAAGVAAILSAGGVAWLVGPDVVELLYGAEFRPDRTVAVVAATGVAGAALAQLLGQLLVAAGRTTALAVRWTTGLAVAGAVLVALPAAPDVTVAVAFAAGTLTAAAGMTRAGRAEGARE